MERNAIEELVRRWLNEAIRDGNVAIFDELLAEGVCDSSGGTKVFGSAPFKRRAQAVHSAFSSIEVAVEELVIDANRAAWRWSLTGTHTGAFAGVAATGRRVTLRGVNFQRFEAGRVAEHWTLADLAGLKLSG
ncbi:MAG TPA: ester cyclase [Polyangiaceae bacterium]|nr:ester cyclase [Polyangiaceae bacterium]